MEGQTFKDIGWLDGIDLDGLGESELEAFHKFMEQACGVVKTKIGDRITLNKNAFVVILYGGMTWSEEHHHEHLDFEYPISNFDVPQLVEITRRFVSSLDGRI